MTDLGDSFGPILSFHVVEQAILNLADKWFDEYLAAAERANGFDSEYFPRLKDMGVSNDFEKWPEEHLPFLLVMYMGLTERPMRFGDGSYMTRALFGASIIVSTPTKKDTRIAAGVYAAAFEAMILQKRGLERPDIIQGIGWMDSRPADLPPEEARTLGAHNMLFQVDVKNVVSEGGRPPEDEPREDPYVPPPPLPEVEPDPADPTQPLVGDVTINVVKEITP